MPQDWLAAHPAGADGLVRISMAYPDARPVFSYADSAELRKRMAFAFGNRAYPDNDSVLRQLGDDRARLSALAGYPRDRKSVDEGKSVYVRVDPGGRRIIKKKKTRKQ